MKTREYIKKEVRKASPAQVQKMRVLLSQNDAEQHKETMCFSVSGGRTSHLSDLNIDEISFLINKLQGKTSDSPATFKMGNKIRRSIFSLAHQLNVINSVMTNADKIKAINEYIEKHEKIGVKKKFNSYTVKELQNLHYQFEVFLKYKLTHGMTDNNI